MPTIGRIGSIQIRLYYDDHGIPHFHAVSPNFDFKFAIADSAVISGTGHIRGHELAAIHAWVQKHKDMLSPVPYEKHCQEDAEDF